MMDFTDEMCKKQFGETYEKNCKKLKQLAIQCEIPKKDAEDLVQDAFLAYAGAEYGMDLPDEDAYRLLSRILKNRCIDYHRGAIRKQWENLEDDLMDPREEPVIEQIIGEEHCAALVQELEHLPKKCREVARLRLLEGYSTDEVCRLLHISQKACYCRVSRIRQYIRRAMEEGRV